MLVQTIVHNTCTKQIIVCTVYLLYRYSMLVLLYSVYKYTDTVHCMLNIVERDEYLH